MAKTYRKVQQWDQWLGQFSGQCVLAAEQSYLQTVVNDLSAYQILLIGTQHQHELLKNCIIPNQLLLGPLLSHSQPKNIRCIDSELDELPIASGSVDLVLLPHILEFLDNPRQLLSEALRIIKPEGHIIISGFNPYSLWGLRRWLSRSKKIPWSGHFMKSGNVKKWLNLADFKLVKQSMVLFRPPLQSEKMYTRLRFLEWLGSKCWPPFGGVYILVAQAKVVPLTPIKMRWKQQLSGMRLPVMGIPKPTTRNHHK